MKRIDLRVAVSEGRVASAARFCPGPLRDDPERGRTPPGSIRADRDNRSSSPAVTIRGRACRVLLRAWPEAARQRDPTPGDRSGSPCGPAPAHAASDGGGDRLPRLPRGAHPHGGAGGGEAARRAVARRREVRDGDDARVRVRHARHRLRHPGVPEVIATEPGATVPPGDSSAPRRRDRGAARGRAAPPAARRAAARRVAIERYSWDDIARAARARSTSEVLAA